MRVVLADDEALLREGLARLLVEAGFEVSGTAQNASGLLRLVEARRPDVAITDIKMPPSHTDEGLIAAREIRRCYPDVGVLVLSHYLESRYAMSLVEELPERSGYLLKDRVSEIGSLTDALRRIGDGECVIDPTSVSRLVTHRRNAGPLAELTPREREVLALMEGHSNQGICEQLFLSPKTLEGHVGNIFRKLDIGEAPHTTPSHRSTRGSPVKPGRARLRRASSRSGGVRRGRPRRRRVRGRSRHEGRIGLPSSRVPSGQAPSAATTTRR